MSRAQNVSKNLKPFGKEQPQPSPEAKSAGWERRRERQAIMDTLLKYSNMSYKELMDTKADMDANPDKYTFRDALMMQYAIKAMKSERMLVDFMDRHVEKAPQGIDVSGGSGQITFKWKGDKPETTSQN